jgi:hypothetical protein
MVNKITPRGMKCKKSRILENSNISAHFLKYPKISGMKMYICECNNLLLNVKNFLDIKWPGLKVLQDLQGKSII